MHEREGTLSRVKQIMIASGEKATSAIRLIDRLEEVRFVHRAPDCTDGRCLIVRLTSLGRSTVAMMLQRLFGPEEPTAPTRSCQNRGDRVGEPSSGLD